ncbi:MAG: GtrA family protein [Allobaculum sp.]|nr:GtrA family protein [Allobaculum sp.]
MDTLKQLFYQYKEPITYLFWGVMSTIANVVTYWICYDMCHLSNMTSTLVAWIVAVVMAFVTNKLWVFESRNTSWKEDLKEFFSFIGFRIVSEIFDLGIMYWAVDLMGMNGLFWKIVANVIVVILNYIFSKFIIFKKPSASSNPKKSSF